MRGGWYILGYHNVDWEDSILTRALGGTTRPDVFAGHVDALRRQGRIVSIGEGRRMLERGASIDEPLFSLWFDDGFAGVREFALPICREAGVQAGYSICSRFVLRAELFWRCKLSYLAHCDGLRFLRSRIRKLHPDVPFRLRRWSMKHFSADLLALIDETYEQLSTEAFRADAFRIFETTEGLRELAEAGWLIANHTASHHPLVPHADPAAGLRDFEECEALVREYDAESGYWVIPFGDCPDQHLRELQRRATVVIVSSKPNTRETWRSTRCLHRYPVADERDVFATFDPGRPAARGQRGGGRESDAG